MTEACIDPTRSAFEAFKALPRDEPLAMLNLVRFRDRAEYEAGVACHHCAQETSEADKARFRERQRQMRLAAMRGERHIRWMAEG